MRESRFIFFLFISIALHIVGLALIVMSKSLRFSAPLPEETVVFMHIVPVGELNNLRPQEQKQPTNNLLEKAKKIESASSAPQAPKAAEQEKKPEETKTKEVKSEEKIPEKQKLDEQKPDEAKLPEAPASNQEVASKPESAQVKEPQKETKEAAKEPVKAKPAPVAKKDELNLQDLAKSLSNAVDRTKEKASYGTENKSNKKTGNNNQDDQTALSQNYDASAAESVTAKTLLQKRIESNWGKPPSMRDYENLQIRVKLRIDINHTVQDIYDFEFLNEMPPPHIQAVIKESIVRAIKLSEPFDMLSLENYDAWSQNSLTFSYK